MNNIPSLTSTRRPTVSKYKLAESLRCNTWFSAETLIIELDNNVKTSLSDASFIPRIKALCGNLVEKKLIKNRIHFRISTSNKGVLLSRVFNSENTPQSKQQKITPYKLSKADKLFNLAMNA